jgi:hypothetical protein
MQTGKTAIRPVALLDPPGGHYWIHWLQFVKEHLIDEGLASMEDLSFFHGTDSVEGAAAIIEDFYRNYDSARYVGERLILRLKRAPNPEQLARLNADFRDLTVSGAIEVIDPTPEEVKDSDALEMQRIVLHADHNFGRIRQLIDALNAL